MTQSVIDNNINKDSLLSSVKNATEIVEVNKDQLHGKPKSEKLKKKLPAQVRAAGKNKSVPKAVLISQEKGDAIKHKVAESKALLNNISACVNQHRFSSSLNPVKGKLDQLTAVNKKLIAVLAVLNKHKVPIKTKSDTTISVDNSLPAPDSGQ